MKIRLLVTVIFAVALASSAWFFTRLGYFENISESKLELSENTAEKANLAGYYGKIPLHFESNDGQADSQVKFLSRGSGYSLFLTSGEAVLALQKPTGKGQESKADFLRMKMAGANTSPVIAGENLLEGKTNYIIGNDPDKWKTNIANYERVRYSNIYDGVDVIYYGSGQQLEYDFVVAPNVSPDKIKLNFDGSEDMTIADNGELVFKFDGNELRQHKPVAYQNIDGQRKEVAANYKIQNLKSNIQDKQVGFEIGSYDTSKPLVIDPVLTLAYSTLLGGSSSDAGFSIAVDSAGNAYVTGRTYSTNFPLKNAFQSTMSGTSVEAYDAFISKLSADGSSLIYSTYLGGSEDNEEGDGIAVDSAGNAYVMGITASHNFPTTANALQPTSKQGRFIRQFFVSKLSASGSSLLYSTYLSDDAVAELPIGGIAVDAFGNAYVTGTTDSPNFPLKNAFQSSFNNGGAAFITKLDTTASGANSLIYSTYLGAASGLPSAVGSQGQSVAADANGNAYITGVTNDPNFPTRNAFQPAISPPGAGQRQTLDAFLTKIDTKASGNASLVYSTFLGGNGHEREAYVAADQAGQAYVGGYTESTNFPTKNAFQASAGSGGAEALFVAKFDTLASGAGSLIYSTYLGSGSGFGGALGIAVDSNGNACVAGHGGVPEINPLPVAPNDRSSFVAKLNSSGSDLIYSTYFWGFINGLALDSANNVYLTGITIEGFNFPTTPGAFQTQPGGGNDAFISKLSFNEATALTISSITPNSGGDGGSVTAVIKGTNFAAGATVKLVMAGQSDLFAATPIIRDDGRAITARFNLLNAPPGARDVVVTNPGNVSVTLPGGFIIEIGSSSQLYTEILGRSAVRRGQEETYTIVCGNRGNNDAYMVPLYIRFPKDFIWKPGFTLLETIQPPAGPSIDYSQVPVDYQKGDQTVVPLLVPRIRAHSTTPISIRLTIPGNAGSQPIQFRIETLLGLPLVNTAPPSRERPQKANSYSKQLTAPAQGFYTNHPQVGAAAGVRIEFVPSTDCLQDIAQIGFDVLGFIPGLKCGAQVGLFFASQATAYFLLAQDGSDGSAAGTFAGTLAGAYSTAVGCALSTSPIGVIVNAVQISMDIGGGLQDCFKVEAASSFTGMTVQSKDPNEKVGSPGVGAGRYRNDETPFPYIIYFENQSSATAPAQEVVVTDVLDVSKFDLDTFSFGDIVVGTSRLSIFPNESAFNKDFDLRPTNNIIARISANLDKTTGVITWRFQSIDPTTGQPTTDPLAGFLPPNRTSPQGEGSVMFTAKLKPGLSTDTKIRNKARIVFDTNAAIDTPEWLNTIDNSKPASSVGPLPTRVTSNFSVTWSGTDAGSGIGTYTIFVSDNGAPFTPFFINTASPNGVFTGQTGHTYSFYSIARDLAGNVEPSKTSAEATTMVVPAVTVSGRVTAPDGRGLRNTTVSITDPNGVKRTATTSSFGFYQFDNVLSGQQYVMGVSSRLYRFATRTLQVTDTLTNVDFVGLE